MKQVLILENSQSKLTPIMESASTVNGTQEYVLGGIFTEFDVKNRNERIYTADKFLPHMAELNERINTSPGVVYGEFDHPDNFDISLGRISHVITKIEFIKEENLVRGEIKLLSTKFGKEAKAIVNDGFPIFVSSRAAGVTEANGVVNLKKLFTYDAVADPGFGSAKMARKDNLNESLGYGSNNNLMIFDLSDETKTNELFEMNKDDMVTKNQLVEYSKYLTGELQTMQEKLENIVSGKGSSPDFDKMQKMITEYDNMQHVQEKLVSYVNYLSENLKHVLIENKNLKKDQGKMIAKTNNLAKEITENSNSAEALAGHILETNGTLGSINNEIKDLAQYGNYLSEHINHAIDYAEYITENLVNTIEFTDYLHENLNASIAFTDYIAENVDAGIDMANYLSEHLESTIEYAEYITENVSDNIEYIDYVAENLDNTIGHNTYIAEKLNKKFGNTSKMISENVDIEDENSEENSEEDENSDDINMNKSNDISEDFEDDLNNSEETEETEGEDYFMSPGEFGDSMEDEMDMDANAEMDMDTEGEEGMEDNSDVISCTRDDEGNLIPAAEGEEGMEDIEGAEDVEGMEDVAGEDGVIETPISDDSDEEESDMDNMMETDPMLSGISAGKIVKIGGTVETARVISTSDEGVLVEMTSTGEQILKQTNEIIPLNDDGTESSLTDDVSNLIEEAKKREASKDEEPHFFTFLSEGQKKNFKELAQGDQEQIKVAINESEGYFSQVDVLRIMHKALEVNTETLEESLVKNMPEDVQPIWENLDTKTKSGIFAQARIHNLNTPDLMEHFWRTRPVLKDNTNMLTESKRTIDTDITYSSELGDDVINMFKNKFNDLK